MGLYTQKPITVRDETGLKPELDRRSIFINRYNIAVFTVCVRHHKGTVAESHNKIYFLKTIRMLLFLNHGYPRLIKTKHFQRFLFIKGLWLSNKNQ